MEYRSIFNLHPARVVRWLGLVIAFLIIGQIIAQVCQHLLGFPTVYGFVPLFNMGIEASLPAYFSSITLLSCAILLAFIAQFKRRRKEQFAHHWTVLAYIFIYLSIDEAVALHEKVGYFTRRFGSFEGIFHYAWVIPFMVLVVIFALSYIRFLLHLPIRWRILFVISGLIYVGGAMGFEMIGGYYISLNENTIDFTYSMISTVEEMLEMIGITVFIYALLTYISSNKIEMVVHSLESEKEATSSVLSES